MFVCKSCGEKFDAPVKFCNKCGSSMIEPETASYSSEPVYGTYGTTYSTPVTPAPSSPAGKILGIISMVCGITGIIFAAIAFFMSCAALGAYYPEGPASLAMFYALFFVLFGIAGMVLGSMSKNKGFTGSMATVGKTLGLVSVIVCGVTFFFSLIALA